MRELWLLRHGKSDWHSNVADFDRPLKKRGERGAKLIGQWLKDHALMPDVIFSSPAVRATNTAYYVANQLSLKNELIRLDQRLYTDGSENIALVLAECPIHMTRILLVGHNPGLEQLLVFLTNDAALTAREKLLPTATLARLAMPEHWQNLTLGCARLLSMVSARDLEK